MSSKFGDDSSNGIYLSSVVSDEDKTLIEEFKNKIGNSNDIEVFPDTLHDIKILRMLRGFDNNVDKAVKMFEEGMSQRKKYGWGKLRREMEEIDGNNDDGLKLTENITRCDNKQILRYLDPNKNDMDARSKYLSNIIGCTLNDAKCSLKGTPYIYNAYCVFDTPKYCEVVDKETAIRTNMVRKIMTECELHHLSLKYNKMVRQMLILDCTDLSFSKLMTLFRCKAWKDYNDEVNQALNPTLVESVGKIIVLNLPWYAKTVYHILRASLPKRSLHKIVLISGDEKQLLDYVDPETLSKIMSHRKRLFDEDGSTALDSENVTIKSGKSIEIPLTVSPGDNIEWEFTVKKNNIDFSIVYYVPSKDGEMEERIIMEPQRCDPNDETVEGNYEVEDLNDEGTKSNDDNNSRNNKSMIVLKFSNARSWMKSSKLDYSIQIERENDEDEDMDDNDDEGKNNSSSKK